MKVNLANGFFLCVFSALLASHSNQAGAQMQNVPPGLPRERDYIEDQSLLLTKNPIRVYQMNLQLHVDNSAPISFTSLVDGRPITISNGNIRARISWFPTGETQFTASFAIERFNGNGWSTLSEPQIAAIYGNNTNIKVRGDSGEISLDFALFAPQGSAKKEDVSSLR